eukprot:g17972.t1
MSATSTQYLLYASLLLGSIGTYNALKDGLSPAGSVSNGGGNLKLEEDVMDLNASMGAVESFLESFHDKSTSLHAELADVRSTLNTVTSFQSSIDSSPVNVDSTYVTSLSKRLALLETANTSSKEAAFHARDTSDANKANLQSLKTVVDSITQQISTTRVSSAKVAQLAEQINNAAGGTSDITAMQSRVDGLTRENEALATRLVGVETWVQGRKSASLNVTADSSAAEVSQATLNNIVDLQTSVDLNTGNIFTLRSDVDINTGDISALGTDLQGQISQNKSDISAVKLIADGTVSDIDNIHLPRISDLEDKVLTLTDTDTTTGTRLDVLEEEMPLAQAARGILSNDLASLSQKVTENTNAIGDIEDDLDGVIQEDIDAAKARIDALESDASHLSEKLKRSGDDIICDGLLRTQQANLGLGGIPIKLRDSTNTDWMIWAGEKREIDGKQSPDGHGFSGAALRMRMRNASANGFVLENSNSDRMFTVRGSDGVGFLAGPMLVNNQAHISGDANFAYFSNRRYQGEEYYAFGQHNNGTTVVNSPNEIRLRVKQNNMVFVSDTLSTVAKELQINHRAGIGDTLFREDNNYISTGGNRKTFFRFGGGDPTVAIRDKEININGTDVLAKLNSLQSQVDAIESNYVKKNAEYYINGHKDNWQSELSYNGNDATWNTSNTRMKIKIF